MVSPGIKIASTAYSKAITPLIAIDHQFENGFEFILLVFVPLKVKQLFVSKLTTKLFHSRDFPLGQHAYHFPDPF